MGCDWILVEQGIYVKVDLVCLYLLRSLETSPFEQAISNVPIDVIQLHDSCSIERGNGNAPIVHAFGPRGSCSTEQGNVLNRVFRLLGSCLPEQGTLGCRIS